MTRLPSRYNLPVILQERLQCKFDGMEVKEVDGVAQRNSIASLLRLYRVEQSTPGLLILPCHIQERHRFYIRRS